MTAGWLPERHPAWATRAIFDFRDAVRRTECEVSEIGRRALHAMIAGTGVRPDEESLGKLVQRVNRTGTRERFDALVAAHVSEVLDSPSTVRELAVDTPLLLLAALHEGDPSVVAEFSAVYASSQDTHKALRAAMVGAVAAWLKRHGVEPRKRS